MYFKTLIIFAVLLAASYSKRLPLPSFIKRCSLSGPNFEECCLRNGREALPTLLKGDPNYNIPNLLPLAIPHVSLNPDKDFSLELTDLKIYNLEAVKLKRVNFGLPNNKVTGELYIDSLTITGQYKINGKLILLPIQGDGKANITVVGCTLTYDADCVKEERKGEDYLKVSKSVVGVEVKGAHFNFFNLFNGNEELGTTTNQLLNENWEQVVEILKPVIAATLSSVGNKVINGIISHVPLKEIFLE